MMLTDSDKKEYELALRQAKKRFGSDCEHADVKNGVCCNCLRKVVTAKSQKAG